MHVSCFYNTVPLSEKVFMLLDKMKIKATNKMRLKHNFWLEASKINTVPNLHSTLISVPKMADADYIAVFHKREICPKTVTLLLCKLMDNHQTCSNSITSPKQKINVWHPMTSPIKRNPVTSPIKIDHPKTLFLKHFTFIH